VIALRGTLGLSVARLAQVFDEPRSTVGRWICPRLERERKPRRCPVSGNPELRQKIKDLCEAPRHRTFGHRFICALLRRRHGIRINRKTVLRVMRSLGYTQSRVFRKPGRPKRVEKMRPDCPNTAWQIDMTSFQLSDLTPAYLVTVLDCYTRQIVGWTLDRRCRASEWTAAVRLGLEARGLWSKQLCTGLTLRSDNGSQPCSKRFIEFLSEHGVTGQYTGYNAPDDNAYVERVIRTIKAEEIWGNDYDTFTEAQEAIADYVQFYNSDRPHSSLDYRTPDETYQATHVSLKAA
jgi:putative transposase